MEFQQHAARTGVGKGARVKVTDAIDGALESVDHGNVVISQKLIYEQVMIQREDTYLAGCRVNLRVFEKLQVQAIGIFAGEFRNDNTPNIIKNFRCYFRYPRVGIVSSL